MRIRATVVMVLVLLTGAAAGADEWPTARVRNVFSANGTFFVRLVPGAITTNPGCAVPRASGNARAEFYVQGRDRAFRLVADVELRNLVSPEDAVVTDTGHLVTFDNWFCTGYGEVVGVYGPGGDLIRSIWMDELFDPSMLRGLPRSVSSRRWRCGTQPIGINGSIVTVFDTRGGAFLIDAQTGTFEYRAGTRTCGPG